jgi:hypothetical protein
MPVKRTAIVIAGMHRSGTSALTRVVNLLGADLAADLVPAGVGNEQGHWESWAALKLHNRMLGELGYDVLSPLDFPRGWLEGPAAQPWIDEIAAMVEADYAGASLFVVKDPRLVLFLPLWIAALRRLEIAPLVIIPFRHPLDVAASLQRRERRFNRGRELPVGHGLAAWLRYVLAAERHSRGQRRSFVAFDRLLADWRSELTRIGDQLAIAWPQIGEADGEIDRFLAPDRHAPSSDHGAPLPAGITPVYQALVQAVDDPQATPPAFALAAERMALAEDLLGAYALLKEREAAQLRGEVESAHRAFAAEIKARDERVAEAAAYAQALEQSRDEALRYARDLEAWRADHEREAPDRLARDGP